MTLVDLPLRYVDTHAHLDEPVFDPDRDEVITAARAAGITRVVNVGYRPARWGTSSDLARRYPDISHMLGLHPHHADEFTDRTCRDLAARLGTTNAIAVGEVGLDYFRDGPNPETQRRAFATQLELAMSLTLPVVIHQRAAEVDLMTVLAAFPDLPRVVLHSFDGTARLAAFGAERGYYFGVGGLVTRAANEPLREIVAGLPLDRLLLETDAPYLVPAGVKDRRNVPANIPRIAARLAALHACPLDEIATRTTTNAALAFSLPVGAAS